MVRARGPGVRKRKEAATELAIAGLNFIAEDTDRLGRFLAMSGISPQSIRSVARDPAFLTGVLDYIAGDETLLVAFAKHAAVKPEHVMGAREVLAGPTWERSDP